MKNTAFFKGKVFSRGWLVAGALTLVMIGFYGAQLSFSVFLKPILVEFSWSRATVSGAMSTVTGIAGLIGIVSGRFTDKYGARALIGIGALLGGLGYLLMSRVSSLGQLYVYFGVIIGISMASCWVPVNATVARWFTEKRVLALGIATSGITVGHMFLPPLVAYFITAHGWRPAYIMLAVIVWVAAIPAIILLSRNPPQGTAVMRRGGSGKGDIHDEVREPVRLREWSVTEAAKTTPFWMLMISGFATAAGFYFVAVHIVAYATDVGILSTSAALILTFMGGANILGKIMIPPVVTRIGNRMTLLLALALQALALFLLMGANGLWMLFALGSVFGFGFGASSPIRTAMIAEFFGLESLGTIIGVIEIAWAVGAICGPVMAGYVFDLSQSYDMAFLAGGSIMVAGVVGTYFLKAPAVSIAARTTS